MTPLCPELVSRLDRAVEAGPIDAITREVKAALEDLLGRGAVALPDGFRQAQADTYARRLLHRDPAGRYTATVMTWGPGQGPPVPTARVVVRRGSSTGKSRSRNATSPRPGPPACG